VDPRIRRQVARYGFPAAFLVAATIAVLLVKAGLNNDASTTTTVGAQPTTTTTAPPRTTTKLVLTTPSGTTTTTTTSSAQYYVIQSGDTFGSIAERYDTTVDELVRLNPDLDPTALSVGDRVRVR
jgi:LysM repeat protein